MRRFRFTYLSIALAGALMFQLAVWAETPASEISLKPISHVQWETQRGSYKGDVVVVDFWATWCVSCIERLPELSSLEKTFKDKPVRFVTLSLETQNTEANRVRALNVLRTHGVDFENYIISDNMLDAFEAFDLVGLPAVIIYDQEGKERFRLNADDPDNQFTEKDIVDAVKTLLGETTS